MSNRRVDISGMRFGGITAIRDVGTLVGKTRKWEFLCDCGNRFISCGSRARLGTVISCQECSRERISKLNTSHGMRDSAEYGIWIHIKERCLNPSNKSFERYGGRGISVCERWTHSFENFIADMGIRPSNKHSIDRINNNGNYEPSNCRWSTPVEQGNNKRNNIMVTIDNETKSLSAWCRERGVSVGSAWSRYKKGLTGNDIFQSTEERISFNGITDTIRGWSERTGIKRTTIAQRIRACKWSVERALTEGVKA